jgi:hypothetical protein
MSRFITKNIAFVLLATLACVPDGAPVPKLSEMQPSPSNSSKPTPRLLDAGLVRPSPDATPIPPVCVVDAGTAVTDATTPPPEDDPMCDGPNKPIPVSSNIYYGTDLPSHVVLNAGQISAIGNFNGCTGLFITPTWILSAEHCGLRSGSEFCIGHGPTDEDACYRASRVIDHPSADMALIEIGEDARNRFPSLEPVPIMTETLDQSWLQRTAEAAGYGRQETGRSGRREFTAEPIVNFFSDNVVIDGQGQQGVCFGDSGGPLFVTAADGSTRIAGVLSNGDPTCVGRDNFTRVDRYRSWIEMYTGPTVPAGPQPCGSTDAVGYCSSDRQRAGYCNANNELQVDTCTHGDQCAWSTMDSGWRCINPTQDPCMGVTYAGTCDQNTLRWCDRGQLQERNCQACEEACIPLSNDRGNFCLPSDCGDLTFRGRCNGNTVEWCNRDGRRETRQCNNGCGYVDAETGYFCQ